MTSCAIAFAPRLLSGLALLLLAAPTLPAQDGVPTFVERAAAAGVQFTHDLANGFFESQYTGAVAVGDFNNDGRMDLFALSGGGGNRPDHLYMNQGGGVFQDQAVSWGLAVAHNGKGCMAADYDKDGWTDLYVTSAGPLGSVGPGKHRLYRNNGNHSFTEIAAAAGVATSNPTQQDGFGSAFGDYDLDGDLDLFVSGFTSGVQGSHLFRNDGDGSFTDVTASIGLFAGTSITVKCFAPRFADMDGDLYPELLLAGDFGTSRYFRNDGDGTFTDLTVASGAGQDENGMGQTVFDFDNDGDFDWYVTSIYLPGQGWTGNKLYRNLGPHQYSEVSGPANVVDGGYAWGTVSMDLDHDGWQDLFCTNGGNGFPGFLNEQSYLWMGDGDGTFTEQALALGLVHTGEGRGAVNFDYDGDGDQDLAIATYEQVFTLWRNDLAGDEIAWLRVFLDTMQDDGLPAHGYGALVTATVDGTSQVRGIWGGCNFLGGSELSAHFGLGAATLVDELRVDWPNGQSTVLTDVPVNQTLTVQAPAAEGWHTVQWGLGGTHGTPVLKGSGTLSDGGTVTLALTRARESATAYFVFSLASLPLPFYGGTLVPDITPPLGGFLTLATDADGELTLSGPWPSGVPAGLPLWFQYWVVDPAAPHGLAGSNAVSTTSE